MTRKNGIEIYSTHNVGRFVADLLEPQRTTFISVWLQNLKICS